MSDRRYLAVFYLPLSDGQRKEDRLRLLTNAIGVKDQEIHPWGIDGSSTILGDWGGIDCESHLTSLIYYDTLILTFREDDFRDLREVGSGSTLSDGESGLVHAFREACIKLHPASAFIATYAWPDPLWLISSQEENVLNGYVENLAKEGLGALYLDSKDALELYRASPEIEGEKISWDTGMILFKGRGSNRW